MGMQTDVKAKNAVGTGALSLGSCRIKGIYWVCGAAAGSISLKNGGSGATEYIKLDTAAGATLTGYLLLPGEGVLFQSDPYLTLTNATSVTIFYG